MHAHAPAGQLMQGIMMRRSEKTTRDTVHSRQKSVYPTLSSDIVRYLQEQGLTLRKVGDLLGLSESFISRVRKKQRSFTLDHLVRLEQATGRALPVILLEATQPSSVPDELRPIYDAFRNLLMAGEAHALSLPRTEGRR
jgi:transcriptional regulator with XRE-family HTH domain